ncbi:hypothetical protein Kpol_1043p33 [Vanderwaltozyma polyspora DSM 70294]|uniref:ferroxidase n=1 Tax=Vanderwaltozyma polyspora (strain ATCC 22028 / DSM 70294 / BCRC 21397 / CBS 2163 / NBRC 10782 / NRRL Y-8283 / UCD 57-17) TaxID=436907 RepID=A7TIQ1_VANPO|nr:uncharacterized protein Kpol_1043p33 [Vanderwaltozyma polyspora DSM 70294]EDO17843.1 hypothetical protein Kpol_1043p33 [Vanderwaltozyma polyspora DSM 70294]
MFKRCSLRVGSFLPRFLAVNTTRHLVTRQIMLQGTPKVSSRINIHKRFFADGSAGGYAIPDEVTQLPIEKYHTLADTALDDLTDRLEEISEKFPEQIPDVELSQGVLTLVIPEFGTYVINKQPPNKQIWLASPISGPNRYDYYQGEWVSLRDNTKLLDVLRDELQRALPDTELTL